MTKQSFVLKKIGSYSFIAGVIIAIVLGFLSQYIGTSADWLLAILILMGFAVGILNIKNENTKEFLLFSLGLISASYFGRKYIDDWGSVIGVGGFYLRDFFDSIIAFILPACMAVALKGVWRFGNN